MVSLYHRGRGRHDHYGPRIAARTAIASVGARGSNLPVDPRPARSACGDPSCFGPSVKYTDGGSESSRHRHPDATMLNLFLVVVALARGGDRAFSGRLSSSMNWKATVTPLASIMGSGFLVSAPLLAGIVGTDRPGDRPPVTHRAGRRMLRLRDLLPGTAGGLRSESRRPSGPDSRRGHHQRAAAGHRRSAASSARRWPTTKGRAD